jgi:indole-3-glycerol phosphate synthase
MQIDVTNVLETIVARKQVEVAQAKQTCPPELLETQLEQAPPVRDFVGSLQSASEIGLIAEIKKASPSAGLIREDFDPVTIANIYEQHGAHCISVLTDEQFFQGSLAYLTAVRQAVSLPVMRKDFLLDRYQLLEARVAGADCVLLIAECLDDDTLSDLYGYATELGMQALVEIYEPENLDRVLKLEPPMLGINNRDLRTFETDLEHTIRLQNRIDRNVLLISESGIRERADVERLRNAGVGAILVGETLMRSDDIGAKADELMGTQ